MIVRVTENGYMPPWLPSPHGEKLADERRLDPAELAALRAWVAAGAPEGDPADLQAPPEFTDGWQLGDPDLVLTLPQPFSLPADGPDVFRNFVLPIPNDRLRYVESVEFRPGNRRVVHHAIVQVDREHACRQQDALDDLPGFAGMDMLTSRAPDGHFIGWTPGHVARPFAPDMAFRLRPGSDLVAQLHMTPSGKVESVRPQIGLRFTNRAPTRFPHSLVLYSENIDIAAGNRDFALEDEFELPVDVTALGIYPHAHYLCRKMRATARLPDGELRELIRIDDWDFNWQDEYRFDRPIELPRGTVLNIDYRYDNSEDNVRNPHQPPRRVKFGQESTDEMGTLSLTVLPKRPDERFELERARWRHALKKKPYDWSAHNSLSALYADARDFDRALHHLRKALDLRGGDYPDALSNLGRVMNELGRAEQAIEPLERAVALDPDHVNARVNLGSALIRLRRPKQAVRQFETASRLRPTFAPARLGLGNALAILGQPKAALPHHRAAAALEPDNATAHSCLANTLFTLEQIDAAIGAYREALRIRPDDFIARYNLGRALFANGSREQAATELEAALRLQPDHPGVRDMLQRCRRDD